MFLLLWEWCYLILRIIFLEYLLYLATQHIANYPTKSVSAKSTLISVQVYSKWCRFERAQNAECEDSYVTAFLERVLSSVHIASKYYKFYIFSQMPSLISNQLLKLFPEALCFLMFQSHFKKLNSYISHTKSLASFKASV